MRSGSFINECLQWSSSPACAEVRLCRTSLRRARRVKVLQAAGDIKSFLVVRVAGHGPAQQQRLWSVLSHAVSLVTVTLHPDSHGLCVPFSLCVA